MPTTTRTARWTIAAIALALCALGVVRTVQTGFSTVDADDPHYLFQGHTVLELRMPEQVDGSFPNLRAPLYGVVLAVGDTIVGGEEFLGAHLISFALALATLAAAVVVGARLGGPRAALGVAIALATMPLVWRMLPNLRIDLIHVGAILGVILIAWRPSTRRWLLAGVAFGLTVLLKESVVLLALLPLAWWGTLPRRDVARLAGVYLGAAVVTAGWWWVLVWVQVREIFPAGNVETTLARDLDRPFTLGIAVWLLVAALGVGWVLFVAWWRHRPDARLVMIAGLATLPPAMIAWQQELDMRQYTQLVVLSCVAAGTAFAHLVTVASRRSWARGSRRALAGGAVVVLALVVAAASQVRTPATQHEAGVAEELSTWMSDRVLDRTDVVMTHRDHGELAIRLRGDVYVHRIEFEPADTPDLADFVWLDENRGRLMGVSRTELASRLRSPTTEYLVLTGPHLLAVPGLERALRTGAVDPGGITRAAEFSEDGYHADVYEVDPDAVDPALADMALSISARAAMLWLDARTEEVGHDQAVAELVFAHPSISGSPEDGRALANRLDHRVACELGLPRSDRLGRH